MRVLLLLALAAGCGGNDDVYESCSEPGDCTVPDEAEAECLDKADDGFCTWRCDVDDDCASEAGGLVCASFESEDARYCFPSCEGVEDEGDEACPADMTCRSTGGGDDNRKVCFPEEAA